MKEHSERHKISSLFDSWAGQERGERMAEGHDELVNGIFETWTFGNDDKILDIGCGNGRALQQSVGKGVSAVAGIDISPSMLEQAKKKMPAGDFRLGSAAVLPWDNSTFSKVISIEAAYYFEDPLKSFSEMNRVLKEDGRIAIVIEYYLENSGAHAWEQQLPFELKLLSTKEWVDLLEAAGFSGIKDKRIVRKSSADDYVESPFFPTKELYVEYLKQGALMLSN